MSLSDVTELTRWASTQGEPVLLVCIGLLLLCAILLLLWLHGNVQGSVMGGILYGLIQRLATFLSQERDGTREFRQYTRSRSRPPYSSRRRNFRREGPLTRELRFRRRHGYQVYEHTPQPRPQHPYQQGYRPEVQYEYSSNTYHSYGNANGNDPKRSVHRHTYRHRSRHRRYESPMRQWQPNQDC